MLVDVLYSCMYLIIYCNLEISFDHLVPQILFVLIIIQYFTIAA